MSELRWDPLKRSWAIIANNRGRLPRDYMVEREQEVMTACPFCYGREDKSPPEVFAIRPPSSAADTQGWKVRVIPNKFPVLRIEGGLDKRPHGLYDKMNGVGAHEVIVENPDHHRDLAELTPAEILDVLRAYRARLVDLRRDDRFRYILIFKNHGNEAGASIPHSHSQVIAVPMTPPMVATELSACKEYYDANKRCLLCDILAQEREERERVVIDNSEFIVFTPYASALPFEMRLVPARHGHDFALLPDAELASLASVLKEALMRLRVTLRNPPYNFVLHSAPPMHMRNEKPAYWESLPYDYHWHIDIAPRLTKIAGFEWGSGFTMNPTPPEIAAKYLREADLTESP